MRAADFFEWSYKNKLKTFITITKMQDEVKKNVKFRPQAALHGQVRGP